MEEDMYNKMILSHKNIRIPLESACYNGGTSDPCQTGTDGEQRPPTARAEFSIVDTTKPTWYGKEPPCNAWDPFPKRLWLLEILFIISPYFSATL